MKRVAQIALALFLAGCSHAPMAYHLQREGLDPVLFPPTKLKQKTTTTEIRVNLKNARARSVSVAGCDIDDSDAAPAKADGKPARVDSSLPDVFLHVKELKSAGIERVESGDTLEFDITDFPKGLVASKIAAVQ